MTMVWMTSGLPVTLAVSVIVPATVPVITVTLGAVVLPCGMVNGIDVDPLGANLTMLSVPPTEETNTRVSVPLMSPLVGAGIDTPIPGCWPELVPGGTTIVSGGELMVIVILVFAVRPSASVACRTT